MKKAISISEQIELLRSRGAIINDKNKATEMLYDIGFYRLGFYFFPFEETYPQILRRTHKLLPNTHFNDAVKLYYFDYDLRHILNRYLTRIEIAFRSYITYYMSFKYKEDPLWFVNPTIVLESFINDFDNKIYHSEAFVRNPQIVRHHNKYPNEKYAPAWKTLEFMTFGSILKLYRSIKNIDDRKAISRYFGVGKTSVFETYINAIYTLRNKCAHGAVLFDLRLPKGICGKGPKLGLKGNDYQNLYGALSVLHFILKHISENRTSDFQNELNCLCKRISYENSNVTEILKSCSGLKF